MIMYYEIRSLMNKNNWPETPAAATSDNESIRVAQVQKWIAEFSIQIPLMQLYNLIINLVIN